MVAGSPHRSGRGGRVGPVVHDESRSDPLDLCPGRGCTRAPTHPRSFRPAAASSCSSAARGRGGCGGGHRSGGDVHRSRSRGHQPAAAGRGPEWPHDRPVGHDAGLPRRDRPRLLAGVAMVRHRNRAFRSSRHGRTPGVRGDHVDAQRPRRNARRIRPRRRYSTRASLVLLMWRIIAAPARGPAACGRPRTIDRVGARYALLVFLLAFVQAGVVVSSSVPWSVWWMLLASATATAWWIGAGREAGTEAVEGGGATAGGADGRGARSRGETALRRTRRT